MEVGKNSLGPKCHQVIAAALFEKDSYLSYLKRIANIASQIAP